MSFSFHIISGETVAGVLDGQVDLCVETIEQAYRAHGQGKSLNPNSYFLLFPEKPSARIIALPAYLDAGFDVAGLKWIGSFPSNLEKGFPRASAVLILNDYETGYPFACMEASIVSATRTAASAALAAERLMPERRARTLGIVGTGLIARYVHRFLSGRGWTFDRVLLHDLNAADAERFDREVLQPAGSRGTSVDLPTVLSQSEVIVFATTAGSPYVTDPALLAHRPLVLHLSLRDLSPELILGAFNVVDDVAHVMNANTSVHLAEKQVGHRRFVAGTLDDVISGRCTVDRSRPMIFSPFGLGVLDLAIGKLVYDRARESNRALEVPNFFHELKR